MLSTKSSGNVVVTPDHGQLSLINNIRSTFQLSAPVILGDV